MGQFIFSTYLTLSRIHDLDMEGGYVDHNGIKIYAAGAIYQKLCALIGINSSNHIAIKEDREDLYYYWRILDIILNFKIHSPKLIVEYSNFKYADINFTTKYACDRVEKNLCQILEDFNYTKYAYDFIVKNLCYIEDKIIKKCAEFESFVASLLSYLYK